MNPDTTIVRIDEPINSATFQCLLRFSPLDKQQRILRQRIKQNADAMVVGGALARHMLWKAFHIPPDARIAYGEFGKPYLPNYPKAHFNISHSGGYVACAVCDVPVGVDIQEIIPFRPEIAARVCSQTELGEIYASQNPEKQFVRIWVKKECAIKLIGSSIGKEIKELQIPPNMQFWAHEFDNVVIGVCTASLNA